MQSKKIVVYIRCTIAFHKLFKLVIITSEPTSINIVFNGSFPTSLAAIGAAIKPPIINPATCKIGIVLSKIKNVIELVNTTKNSARQTDPIT